MTMAQGHKKGFWEELQSLDDQTKQKVLIITTAIVMVIIIYFWLAYFNNLVAGVAQQSVATAAPAAASTPVASAGATGPSAWQDIGNGFMNIAGAFAWIGHGIVGIFQSPKQYVVQPY